MSHYDANPGATIPCGFARRAWWLRLQVTKDRTLSKAELVARSEFRYRLRRFLHAGEQAAAAHGVTFAQYLLLLHTQGMRERDWALVGEIAELMQLRHHSAVELVSRCETAGLVRRRQSRQDKRQVEIHLTAAGQRALQRIAHAHTDEVASLMADLNLGCAAAAQPRRVADGSARPSGSNTLK